MNLGLAGLVTNNIQFGEDQLIDASTSEIASFISCYVWLYSLAFAIVVTMSQTCFCGVFSLPLAIFLISFIMTLSILSNSFLNHWLVRRNQ